MAERDPRMDPSKIQLEQAAAEVKKLEPWRLAEIRREMNIKPPTIIKRGDS